MPKLDTAAQVDDVAGALGGRPVVAGIETVRGVADAREVLRSPVVACYFGAEDYIADLGGVRTPRQRRGGVGPGATSPWPPASPASPPSTW